MAPEELQRFNFFERVVHWVVGLAFVYLFATGVAFSYPSLFWLTIPLGGGPAARALHPWAGVVFALGLAVMFVLWVRDMGLRRRDLEWMKAIRHYALHRRDKVPPAGRYNAGQKVFFWVQVACAVAHLATGAVLWWPEPFGASLLVWSRFLHFFVTLPSGLFMIVHVYLGTVAYPGTAGAMLHGRVSRAWARLHHPLWAEEEAEP